jgi:hypothetical protein
MKIDKDEIVKREFLKRFTGPDGYCRNCGAKPEPKGSRLERATWYATHSCPPKPAKP